MRVEAGKISMRVPLATFLPLRILAAMARSSRRPLVQEPMTIWLSLMPSDLLDGLDVVHGVRAGDLRLQLGDVDGDHLVIDRVGVGAEELEQAP